MVTQKKTVAGRDKPSVARKTRKAKADPPRTQSVKSVVPALQTEVEPRPCELAIPHWLVQENGKGSVAYFVFGRFQPGHVGHKVVFEGLKAAAREGNTSGLPWLDRNGKPASNVFVFVSRTQNKRSCTRQEVTKVKACENPLGASTKVELLKHQNPEPSDRSEPAIHFIDMGNPNAAIKMLLDCYNEVVMYVGSDRVAAFQWLKKTYPGKVEIRSAGEERDDTSKSVAGMSSSKIRRAVVDLKRLDSSDSDYVLVKENLGVGTNMTDDVIDKIKRAYSKAGGKKRKRKAGRKTRKRRRKPKPRTGTKRSKRG
jgi:hypothetical protein